MISLPKVKPLVYGYANARVHGMKGLLLTRENYAELTNVKSIDGMMELLQRTHYKKYLLDAAVKYSGSLLIESACGRHYSYIASKISRIAPKDDKEVIDAFLARWDDINLKTIIVSKKLTQGFAEVKPTLIPAGSLTLDELENIYNAEEKELFNEIKKTKFGRELFSQSMQTLSAGKWARFKKAIVDEDQYSQVQTMIDSCIYLFMEKRFSKYRGDIDVNAIYNIFRKEITINNIIIIERIKRSGIKDQNKIKEHLTEGGTLDKSTMEAIISADKLENVFPMIKRSFPSFNPEKVTTLVELETALQKALSAEKIRTFHRTILSVGTLLGFLLLKEEEMNNLRKIARAKEFGIESKEVMQTLLIPGET